ncbi:hypothetical protein HHK36_026687 [Tetracentron sinense]|uniref:Terpene synthase N-terminal domain-containing protein n=1 Tax=Tetracentron sinense TaxID=13715 RepID=A0A835D2V3_TETSI|nr:hypothetical protein HHK36_026687 [Tetracentron sinense]
MSSPATLIRLSLSLLLVRSSPASSPPAPLSCKFSGEKSGVWSLGARDKQANFGLHCCRSNAISKPHIQVYTEVIQEGPPVINLHEILQDDREEEVLEVSTVNDIAKRVNSIRSMLGSMEDGEISISAYDTAWVALVEDISGSGAPQFPSSLHWIVDNQLPDGSWGDPYIFSAHDRIINTLACVIALKSWKIYPGRCEKGLYFIRENMSRLTNESSEHMPIGFEVAFPSLIEIARGLDLEIPDDSPFLQEIYAKRNLKLRRIPKDMMHLMPTTLLHSLEGMPGLDWEKLLKLQCRDGSFLFSPSSTAFALMQTKDDKCLKYLKKAVERFSGGVPNVYPVDLFEHIWAVDRLQRLGISRYFRSEIKECLNYVYRYWTEDGICWARNSPVHDIDDTAMGFRLLRLHGHDVSADAFRHFEKGGEFFCFAGQSNQAVTGIFNLYRASQVLFPGEKILEEAKAFASKFLREKQASKQLLDKWIIIKDLPGEVGHALDLPWYASLPRIEARFYIEQYGGEDDVWIGKTLYRMPYVNNNVYLELAKIDFNNCQALHQLEWVDIQKWYTECNLREFGVTKRKLLLAYFLAAASIFEPERSIERLAWGRTQVLVEAVSSYWNNEGSSIEQRRAFVDDFNSYSINSESNEKRKSGSKTTGQGLVRALLGNLGHLSLDVLVAHGRDIRHQLRRLVSTPIFFKFSLRKTNRIPAGALSATVRAVANPDSKWETWMLTWHGEEEEAEAEVLIVRTINLCAGRSQSEELLSHPQYQRLSDLTNIICQQLRRIQKLKEHRNDNHGINTGSLSIEADMQELVQCVLGSSDGIDSDIKQTFLTVAKSFYYTAYCTPATINLHISKVLFEKTISLKCD